MTENEKLYTQRDLDFYRDNADEYFNMTIKMRRIIKELREALAIERGGGTPLSAIKYRDLHNRSGRWL